jgi:hypothetical protein
MVTEVSHDGTVTVAVPPLWVTTDEITVGVATGTEVDPPDGVRTETDETVDDGVNDETDGVL